MTRSSKSILAGSLALAMAGAAQAASPSLSVTVDGVVDGKSIPAEQAVCLPTEDGKSNTEGKNLRPTISWRGAPENTASFAVFMMDPDVPADFSDAGKEGKVIAEKAKRQDFYHYGVVNIPANVTTLEGGSGAAASGVELANDMGINKYVAPVAAYGGPCPPWNDARVHHYHYIVLALDKDAPVLNMDRVRYASLKTNPNNARHTLDRLLASKHVLAKGTVIGTYTLNPSLMK